MAEFVGPRGVDMFAIEVQYTPGTDAPSRVFRALSQMIEAAEVADRMLMRTLTTNFMPMILLEDIEKGSVRAWLRSTLDDLPDHLLAGGETKKIIGHYLVKAKRAIINWEDRRTTIEGRADVLELQDELAALAQDTGVNAIPAYTAPPIGDLVSTATAFSDAAKQLRPDETLIYRIDDSVDEVTKTFDVVPETLEALVTQKVLASNATMVLKVKKPDFLGSSQWELRHGSRAIPVTIEDEEWLAKFRARDPSTTIMPGDAIQADVRVENAYGYDGELVRETYIIQRVHGIVRPGEQTGLRLDM